MRFLYSLAFLIFFAFCFPVLVVYRKTRAGLAQRFGFYPQGTFARRGEGRRIWLHGASAGDLLALSPMIKELRARFPGCTLVVSTITNSGYLMAKERIQGVEAVIFAPWDLPGATQRAARAIKPDLLVLEYTEIWPNLIWAAKKYGAKIAITNGRFSPVHLQSYKILFSVIGNPLKAIDLFLMREDEEAQRALTLGAPLERVWVTGNTKFDALVSNANVLTSENELVQSFGFPEHAQVLICGSTHEGEESLLLQVFERLLENHPNLYFVLAPRYIERAEKLKALAKTLKLPVCLRTEKEKPKEARVAILDTIGELSLAYRAATLVFVGGSFIKNRGGQNILEPAAQGKPVLFGPHMENFHDSVQVLVGRGGIQVKDCDHLYRVANDLLNIPEKLQELGSMAKNAVSNIKGASERNVSLMVQALEPTKSEKYGF